VSILDESSYLTRHMQEMAVSRCRDNKSRWYVIALLTQYSEIGSLSPDNSMKRCLGLVECHYVTGSFFCVKAIHHRLLIKV
jgi:hypothetical protein